MITILIFMFVQDWVFGLVSVALIPIQGYVIPKLQKQINTLKKERVRKVRKLSEAIGETVAGAAEIRIHGTQHFTLSGFSKKLGDLFAIRLQIFQKKFFMKFLNNTIGQITPFMFYLFGGYLVIKGDLTIGALVAAIAAYKDLTSPWRELLNFYQLHEDSKIKYQQIIELFNPGELMPEIPIGKPSYSHLHLPISIRNLSWVNSHGERILSGVNAEIAPGSMVAIVGDYPTRRTRLSQILTGLEKPTSGAVLIGDTSLESIAEDVFRRKLGFVGPDPHMFTGSIRSNFEYGLNVFEPDFENDPDKQLAVKEAVSAGNRLPFEEGWAEKSLSVIQSESQSEDWYQDVLAATGAKSVVYQRSLLEVFDPVEKPALANDLLRARISIRDQLTKIARDNSVIRFDPDVYNFNATVLENLLFGMATDERFGCEECAVDPFIYQILTEQDLIDEAVKTGYKVTQQLLAKLDRKTISHQLIEHFGLEEDTKIESLRLMVDHMAKGKGISNSDQEIALSFFLKFIPEEHRFAELGYRMSTKLVQARRNFTSQLPEDLKDAVIQFDATKYHPSLTVKDNLLFGRISSRHPQVTREINEIIEKTIDAFGLRGPLQRLLGESQVGISGSRLNIIAKHRISLGRSLMKRPEILVLHDALGPLDEDSKVEALKGIQALLPDCTVIVIDRQVSDYKLFDQVYEFKESGPLQLIGDAEKPVPVSSVFEELPAVRSSNPLDLISNAKLFSFLSPNHKSYLAENSRLISIKSDSIIYKYHDEADAAWLVVSGKVCTFTPEGDQIGHFVRPEVFGGIEVLADRTRILTAKAEEDSVVLRIEADAIEMIALSDAQVSRTMLRALTNQWYSEK